MPPFLEENQIIDESAYKAATATVTSLSDYPSISLDEPARIRQFLHTEFFCLDLERMAPHLWIMTTFCSKNINPLHRQKVKGRDIVVTEESRLHLTWIHNRVFIKPLPKYLLSYTFWQTFLDSSVGNPANETQKAATGFLRTYAYLIQRETDFNIAQQDDLRLIPKDVDWISFCKFISAIGAVDDAAVSQRYLYGELRLTRLNFYSPFLLRKFHFEQVHGQYSDYFGRMYGPILFVFALVTTALNSLQVALTAEQLLAAKWEPLWHISRWFGMLSLGCAAIVSLAFVSLWLRMFVDEWVFTLRRRYGSKRRVFLG